MSHRNNVGQIVCGKKKTWSFLLSWLFYFALHYPRLCTRGKTNFGNHLIATRGDPPCTSFPVLCCASLHNSGKGDETEGREHKYGYILEFSIQELQEANDCNTKGIKAEHPKGFDNVTKETRRRREQDHGKCNEMGIIGRFCALFALYKVFTTLLCTTLQTLPISAPPDQG